MLPRRKLFSLRHSAAVVLAVAGSALGQIAGGTFTATGDDVVPRYFHAASTLPDGTVMVSGGLGLTIIPPSLFSRSQVSFFNPETSAYQSTFVPLNGGAAVTVTLAQARSSHTQTTLRDGRVLITGGDVGASGTSPGTPTASVELFNPWTGVRTAGPAMNLARAAHTATLLADGRVLIAGGSSWQIFNPAGNTWTAGFALLRSRTAHAAVLLTDFAGTPYDDRVLLAGGSGSGPGTFELLNPATGGSTLLASTMSPGVDDLAATRLADGRVFVVGGQSAATGDTVANTYLLDPVGDSTTPGPPVPNRPGGIADHQLLRFGRYVVILGGEQEAAGVDTVLDYAAIFDAATEQWLATGAMTYLHDDFAVAPLRGCRALLVDGGIPFLSAEAPSARTEVFEITLPDACRPGDLDRDGDLDHRDYDLLADCLTGPLDDASPSILPFRCHVADLDADQDVDLFDFALFVAAF